MTTHIKALVVPVAEGLTQLASDIEATCLTVEQHRCEIVSVSHATQAFTTHGAPMWSVLITYRQGRRLVTRFADFSTEERAALRDGLTAEAEINPAEDPTFPARVATAERLIVELEAVVDPGNDESPPLV